MVVFYECFFIELIEILKNLLMDKIRVFVKIEYRHYESDTDTLIERRFGFWGYYYPLQQSLKYKYCRIPINMTHNCSFQIKKRSPERYDKKIQI